MPNHWKILSKNFLLNIFFFTLFFASISIFFKLTKLIKYFILGADLFDLTLLLALFLASCLPVVISSTCFISSYISTAKVQKTSELKAFQSLSLHPSKMFSSIIFLSCLFSILNLSLNIYVIPSLNKQLNFILEEKKQKISVFDHYFRKFNKEDRYISMDLENGKKKGDNLLIIPNWDCFCFFLSDKIEETEGDLIFTNSSLFKIFSENEDFNTISISQNQSMILPKKSISPLFPFFSIHIEPLHYSLISNLSKILFSFYPLILTILGIVLSLKTFKIFSSFFLVSNVTMLVLSTMLSSYFLNILAAISIGLIFPLYFISLHKLRGNVS
jgi:hypothetical protein